MTRLSSPELEILWKHVLDDWDNDAAHDAFLEHCRATDQLPEAATRYRGMAGDRERGPSAQKRLQGVAALAMASLESLRTPPQADPHRAGRLLLVLFFLAASVALLLYAMR